MTLAGGRYWERMVAGVLAGLDLPELVAHSPGEYVKTTVALARDLSRLSELRSTLRDRMKNSPVMNAPRFARNVERAYREMWQTWCVIQPA